MLKDVLIEHSKSIIKSATYTIGGVVKNATIGKVVQSPDGLAIYIFCDDATQGKITNAKLYDINNAVLVSKDYNTTKDTIATTTLEVDITFTVT